MALTDAWVGRQRMGTAFLSLAALALAAVTGTAGVRADKPNVVVIVADDLGYADVGFQGCKDIPTPHLDALAKAGVRLHQRLRHPARLRPTRAGLLTGRYQHALGHEVTLAPREVRPLPRGDDSADALKSAGYATVAVGKWHLGQLPQFRPLARGFTDHYGFLGGGRSFLPLKESRAWRSSRKTRTKSICGGTRLVSRIRIRDGCVRRGSRRVHPPPQGGPVLPLPRVQRPARPVAGDRQVPLGSRI